jgi:hypothetical protein
MAEKVQADEDDQPEQESQPVTQNDSLDAPVSADAESVPF